MEIFNLILDLFKDAAQEGTEFSREGFIFDQEQDIERKYMEQDMYIKTFMMYREDMRDMVEWTTSKMDSYVLPILFLLGLCFLMLVHGDFESDANFHRTVKPELMWLYVINLAESFLFLFAAAWLAAHASVCAHSHGVRFLTQRVRLPMPSDKQIEAAKRYAAEFELGGGRVPFLDRGSALDAGSLQTETRSESSGGAEQKLHMKIYRERMSEWQPYEAYCRVCISLGAYTLVQALAYYLVAYFTVMLYSLEAAACCAIILSSLGCVLFSLDLRFETPSRLFTCVALGYILLGFGMLGPLGAVFCLLLEGLARESKKTVAEEVHAHDFVYPMLFFSQALLLFLGLFIARPFEIEYLATKETLGDKEALPREKRWRHMWYMNLLFPWRDSLNTSGESSGGSGEQQQEQEQEQQQQQQQQEQQQQEEAAAAAAAAAAAQQRMPEHLQKERLQTRLQKAKSALKAWEQMLIRPEVASKTGMENEVKKARLHFEYIKKLEYIKNHFNSNLDGAEPEEYLLIFPDGKAYNSQTGKAVDNEEAGNDDKLRITTSMLNQEMENLESRVAALQATEECLAARRQSDKESFYIFRQQDDVLAKHVPWVSFRRSTCILVCVWALGGMIYVGIPLYLWLSRKIEKRAMPMKREYLSMLAGAQLAFNGSRLPGRPLGFHPVGLSCASARCDRLLIADEYGVFKVHVSSVDMSAELSSVASIDTDVQHCLDALPEFRNAGLLGISMQCMSDGHCDALLLGAGGTQIVRCPFAKEGRDKTIPTLVGVASAAGYRSWNSIVPSESLRSEGMFWWGLPKGSSRPEILHVQFNKDRGPRAFVIPSDRIHWGNEASRAQQSFMGSGMFPEAQERTDESMSALSLHSREGLALFGLSDSGSSIQAWSIDGRHSAKLYELPVPAYLGRWRLPAGFHWSSICSDRKNLYIAGMRHGASMPEIWRFDLPSPVALLSETRSRPARESEKSLLTS